MDSCRNDRIPEEWHQNLVIPAGITPESTGMTGFWCHSSGTAPEFVIRDSQESQTHLIHHI